jgi:hypothetical protein
LPFYWFFNATAYFEVHMGELGNYLDGRPLLTKSPIRSGYFVSASIPCFGAVVITVYLVLAYHRVMNLNFIVLLCVYIGLHSFYQWWRCVRSLNRVRQLYTSVPEDQRTPGTPMDLALRVATGGAVDLLFYGSGMTICSLVLIWALLRHLSGTH